MLLKFALQEQDINWANFETIKEAFEVKWPGYERIPLFPDMFGMQCLHVLPLFACYWLYWRGLNKRTAEPNDTNKNMGNKIKSLNNALSLVISVSFRLVAYSVVAYARHFAYRLEPFIWIALIYLIV